MTWILLLQVVAVIFIAVVIITFLKRKSQKTTGKEVDHKKQFYKTLVSGVLMALILAQPHVGFMIYIFALPLLIWFIYSTYVSLTKPDRRKWQLIRMSVWIISVLVILGIHYSRRESTRHYADYIVAAINKFELEQGTYPDNIEMIGVSRQQLKEKLGLSGYSYVKGKPDLFYADTFIVFQTHHYDFLKDTWVYHGD